MTKYKNVVIKKPLLTATAVMLAFSSAAFGILPSMASKKQSTSPGRLPRAENYAEYHDYQAACGVTGGSAAEKAADSFASRYPHSELRAYLYSKAMHDYQTENNPGKMLAMGEKVLLLDPDNSIALVLTATVLADGLSDADQ